MILHIPSLKCVRIVRSIQYANLNLIPNIIHRNHESLTIYNYRYDVYIKCSQGVS